MKNIIMSTVVGMGLLLPSTILQAQVVTTGGSILGRPLAISGRTAVRFDQLPANVQQAIRAQAGNGVIASVQQGTYNGPAYRVTFTQNGAERSLQFTANGSVLSGDGGLITSPLVNARTIAFQQLPTAVQQAVSAQASGGDITSVMQGRFQAPVYDALVQASGSPSQHVIVTQSGGLVQGATVNEAAGASAPANANTGNAAAQSEQVTGSLAFKDLGWSVQKPMLDRTGYAHIDNVQQMTMPDGRVGYRGTYTKNGQQYQITVAQDGNVLSEGLVDAAVAK
ncbi:MAG: hypothetical protein JWO95_3092 [Verrucomicrobiales bacterium]|nr:hypothetical protein [Verrucomicrobiales bacterium]